MVKWNIDPQGRTNLKTNANTITNTMTKTFREEPQRSNGEIEHHSPGKDKLEAAVNYKS